MFRVLDFPKITLGEIDIDLSSKITALTATLIELIRNEGITKTNK